MGYRPEKVEVCISKYYFGLIKKVLSLAISFVSYLLFPFSSIYYIIAMNEKSCAVKKNNHILQYQFCFPGVASY